MHRVTIEATKIHVAHVVVDAWPTAEGSGAPAIAAPWSENGGNGENDDARGTAIAVPFTARMLL